MEFLRKLDSNTKLALGTLVLCLAGLPTCAWLGGVIKFDDIMALLAKQNIAAQTNTPVRVFSVTNNLPVGPNTGIDPFFISSAAVNQCFPSISKTPTVNATEAEKQYRVMCDQQVPSESTNPKNQ